MRLAQGSYWGRAPWRVPVRAGEGSILVRLSYEGRRPLDTFQAVWLAATYRPSASSGQITW
jgi:hypothetical protein